MDPGGGGGSEYVSCIKIDGKPILPPLMSEERRQEMRYYREVAIEIERMRAVSIPGIPLPVESTMTFQALEQENESDDESKDSSFESGDNTITNSVQELVLPEVESEESDSDLETEQAQISNSVSALPDFPDEEGEDDFNFKAELPIPITIPPPEPYASAAEDKVDQTQDLFDASKVPSTSIPEPNGVPEDDDKHSQTSSDSDSSASSTGTFIIQTSYSQYSAMHSSFLSEGEVVDDDDLDEAANLYVRDRNVFPTDSASDRPSTPNTTYKDDNMSTISTFTNETTSTMGQTSSLFDSFGNIGLSKLKSKMQNMSPSLYKIPGDTRSPLLKGVIFMDPLNRPREVKRIPAAALDPAMKPKFDRLTAAVKGYLVRRLLKTEKMRNLIQTIHDTVELVLNLYEEGTANAGRVKPTVKPEDLALHSRLIQQVNGACAAFRDILFKLTPAERMAIISTDRTKMRQKELKVKSTKAQATQSKNISVATLRCLERRKTTVSHSPVLKRPKCQPEKLPLHVPSHIIQHPPNLPVGLGTQSVKSKQPRSIVVSPKRRRMTATFLKPSSPAYRPAALVRLSQKDSLSKSTSSLSKSNKAPTNATQKAVKGDTWATRKKMESTFVKPKTNTRPLVTSNH